MGSELPTVEIKLWLPDAVVLFDWLMSVDLNKLPIEHPAQKRALADLLSRLQTETSVPYGRSGQGLTHDEISLAQSEVARYMGW